MIVGLFPCVGGTFVSPLKINQNIGTFGLNLSCLPVSFQIATYIYGSSLGECVTFSVSRKQIPQRRPAWRNDMCNRCCTEGMGRRKLARTNKNTKIKNLFLFDISLSCFPNLQGKHFFFYFSYFGLILTCFYLKLCAFLTSAHILRALLNVIAQGNWNHFGQLCSLHGSSGLPRTLHSEIWILRSRLECLVGTWGRYWTPSEWAMIPKNKIKYLLGVGTDLNTES